MVTEEMLLRMKIHIPATFVKDFKAEKAWAEGRTRYSGSPYRIHHKAHWRLYYKGEQVGEGDTQKDIRLIIKKKYIEDLTKRGFINQKD